MRLLLISLLCGFSFAASGCRCCGLTWNYSEKVDRVCDYKACWDHWYCPKLDISRAGMPDWCGPINSKICPCRSCQSACCRSQVYYPAEHTLAYEMEQATAKHEQDDRVLPPILPSENSPVIPIPPQLGQ